MQCCFQELLGIDLDFFLHNTLYIVLNLNSQIFHVYDENLSRLSFRVSTLFLRTKKTLLWSVIVLKLWQSSYDFVVF